MQISQQDIEKLKKIYQEETGAILSDVDALEMGQRLLTLFKIIYRPLPSDSDDSGSSQKFDSFQSL
ncbi:hypothetical protein BROC_01086 [Candidatus Brocadiaceae bacterium]|nr:hypothetical protein BROC_01086 [Candidatus Brocadiaceae bacterium]